MGLEASPPERIILIEQEIGPDHLVSQPAGPQTLTTTRKIIEEIRDPYPQIDQIVVLQKDELLVSQPPPVLPAGDACFPCILLSHDIAALASKQIIDINVSPGISLHLSIDILDRVNKLYRSYLTKVVVMETDVSYNSSKSGDAIPCQLIFNKSVVGISAQYTNLHSDEVTVIVRRI